ncbi:hypothetical protein Htur_3063 [Haloterrigena turkmenica DSM 5511]|uniref:Uncharacterized protein n=1 Tax=Haloterrigena turkmenica (strain ATCC 51198 / DSM 5511 / JCM 9101 / NCIMB 13204 / VKM B-1734 / 4k) TaxID=543526 RepID=D2RYW0_HALTV|nr:hypothetical protein [Haloterrigena turkmenica]ADB61928.1 hypothetical protein Htur_3063 [Haloterrigena turkmenica DSM 5511]
MAPTQVQRAIDVAERELNLAWAAVAAVVLIFAGRLLLEGTASLSRTVALLAYAGVVTASAFVRVRQWAGIWFLWAAFAAHFALTFSAAGMGTVALVLLLATGVLAVLGVQDVRSVLER